MDMWGSILGAVALGSQEISEYTGSADEKRAQELELAKLNAEAEKQRIAAQNEKYKYYGKIALVIFAVIVIGFLILRKKK